MDRSKMYGIGASDVPTILGINPFCSPLELYCRLTEATDPVQQTEPMYWGKKKEQIIAERFAEDHNVKLMAYKKRFYHKTMPFFSCELDRIVVGTDVNVECKSVTEYKANDWAGGVEELPAYVIVQTQAQMGLSDRKETWVCCLLGSSNYKEKLVKFDAEFYADIEKKVAQFWNMVENRIPPMAMLGDDDDLLALYPKNNEELALMNDMETAVARRMALIAQINDLTDEKELIEIQLKEVIKDQLGIKTDRYKITWKEQSSSRVNIDALKADGLYEKYLKTGSTRVLRVSLNKEKGK